MSEEVVTTGAPPTETAPRSETAAAPAFSWKSNLAPDFANSPTIQKYGDDKDGFNSAIKAHLSLEKMLGHEKVPVPKGPEDTEAWNLFAKAMGIPDKAEQYGIPDVDVPADMKGLSFNKQEFAEICHRLKLTPSQTKELWSSYTGKSMEGYGKALKEHKEKMTQVVNQMRSEWGDAYDSKVELGQMVINKFSSDQEANDWLTSTLSKDPRGIKFLAKIGDQFAENKLGEFGQTRFSLTPDQAKSELDKIRMDPKDPYNDDRAPADIRQRRIDQVNGLIAAAIKK